MKKSLLLIGAIGAMMLVGCAKGHRGDAQMGAVSGACSKEKCCGKSECKNSDKANMGAVSGESCKGKKDCAKSCTRDKASMGAVSGQKKDCSKSCTGEKASMGAVSGEKKSCSGKTSCSGK